MNRLKLTSLLIALSIGTALITCATNRAIAPVDGKTSALGSLLIELEEGIQGTCQSAAWSTARPGWARDVRNAPDIQSMGKLVIQCEDNIQYMCQTQEWKSIRPVWLSKATGATSASELGACLLQMEEHIVFSNALGTWMRKRLSWKARVRSL